jgi:aquaporin Z
MLGALAGAVLLYLILSGRIADYDVARSGLGQNGWGANYLGGFSLTAAFITEIIATFVFIFVILRATGERGPGPLAGLIVGLTLVALHFPFINVTGLSVNPARSFGPAIVVGGEALAQVWLFLIAPMIGGVLAGVVDRLTERPVPKAV